MPQRSHVCPECTYEHPCFFTEGDIVSLKDDLESNPSPWTGMVLDIDRDDAGRVYRILWGPPPVNSTRSGAPVAAKHSGAHRGDELQRFLVPLYGLATEIRMSGGGAKEPQAHQFAPPAP
jgi:hypothetical protein